MRLTGISIEKVFNQFLKQRPNFISHLKVEQYLGASVYKQFSNIYTDLLLAISEND